MDQDNIRQRDVETSADAKRSVELDKRRIGSSSRSRRPTGPKSVAGKRRSKYNAVKRGIFAKAVLLESESPTEYRTLLDGFRQDLQPEGTLETQLVEYLAGLFWRQRRLLYAERAEVEKVFNFRAVESVKAQVHEAWDQFRAGETAGGVLRNTSNPFVIQEAITVLRSIRDSLEKRGFEKGDPWLLRKLYGLDHDGSAPLGPFYFYQLFSKRTANPSQESENPCDPAELKREALEMLDHEIMLLETKKTVHEVIDEQTRRYEAIAALIPLQDTSDRLMRYEAHLSRGIDRTLNRLERLQRMRQGHPMSPTVRLEI